MRYAKSKRGFLGGTGVYFSARPITRRDGEEARRIRKLEGGKKQWYRTDNRRHIHTLKLFAQYLTSM